MHPAREFKPQPSTRQIAGSIHKLDLQILVNEYNRIRAKVSRLPKRQRDLVVAQVMEYIKLGIVKIEKNEEKSKEIHSQNSSE